MKVKTQLLEQNCETENSTEEHSVDYLPLIFFQGWNRIESD